MNMIAIDTSTERATVALLVDGEIYSEEQSSLRQHAQCLLPMIERLLAAGQLSLQALDGVVFGCGPGSFTGLRITCSIAKALAYAHDLPLYPVSSLASVAYEAYQTHENISHDTRVLAMMDARMQQAYWAYFDQNQAETEAHVSCGSEVTIPAPGPIILAGVGFEAYATALPKAIQNCLIKQQVIFPSAHAMIRLAETGRIQAISAEDALPMYVRNQVTQGGTHG